jgi:hypothetical protein
MRKKYPYYLILFLIAYAIMLIVSMSIVPLEYLFYNWPLLLLLVLPAAAFLHYLHTGSDTKLRLITLLLLAWLVLFYLMISSALL